jgi:hypothetical protein
MSIEPQEVAERVGRDNLRATFEVARVTDTEEVEANPHSVQYGRHKRGPLVILNYNKHHPHLPPWESLVSFSLEGEAKAEFGMPEYSGTSITGNLKSIQIVSPTVKIYG